MKAHPADQLTEAAIASAVSFSAAVLFNGRQNVIQRRTLAEAMAWAERLEAAAANGRRAIVYAIAADGRAVLVPR